MNKKELIVVLSYCPTKEKKEILLNFLISLQNFREKYDILVTSHSVLDEFFFEYFDYFFYDKNNTILTDIEYKQNAWYMPLNGYVIWSSYVESGNTTKAIWDLIILSVSIAQSMDYKKIHMFEYDSLLNDNSELIENSFLLEKYDYVVYKNKNGYELNGSYISFNTERCINEWKSKNENVYKELFWDIYPKIPENITFELIKNQRKVLQKNANVLETNGVEIDKMIGNPLNWSVPFFDTNDNFLKFFVYNSSSKPFNIKVIYNNELFNLGSIDPNFWIIENICEFDKVVGNLIVLKNDVKILELNFDCDDYKQRFKKYNSSFFDQTIIDYIGN